MERFLNGMEKVFDWACFLFLMAMISAGFVQIVMRYVFSRPFVWSQELLIALNVWFVFFAAFVALRHNRHIAITLMIKRIKSPLFNQGVALLQRGLVIFFLIILLWGTIKIQPSQLLYKTPALGLPRNYLSVSMGISCFVMLLNSIFLLWKQFHKKVNDDNQGNRPDNIHSI